LLYIVCFMGALVVAIHKWSFHVHRLVVIMDSCGEHVDRSPVQMSSMRRMFSTSVVADDDARNAVHSIVMPVT
jgi:hypothetical protein